MKRKVCVMAGLFLILMAVGSYVFLHKIKTRIVQPVVSENSVESKRTILGEDNDETEVEGQSEKNNLKWNREVSKKMEKDDTIFYSYFSEDKKEAWIYKVCTWKDEEFILEFPEKIEGVPVTRICSDFEATDNYCINIFGSISASRQGEIEPGAAEILATKVLIPQYVREIGEFAFLGAEALQEVEILGNIEKIENASFSGCTSLQTVTIASQLTDVNEIAEKAFENCKELRNVEFSKDSVAYSFENGMILSKDRKILWRVLIHKGEIKIPETVETIAERAVVYSMVERVSIPKSVTKIGAQAFQFTQCKNWMLDKENPVYGIIENNCIYNKQTGQLVHIICNGKKEDKILPKQVLIVDETVSISKSGCRSIVFPFTLKELRSGWYDSLMDNNTFDNSPIICFTGEAPKLIGKDEKEIDAYTEDKFPLPTNCKIIYPEKYIVGYGKWKKMLAEQLDYFEFESYWDWEEFARKKGK